MSYVLESFFFLPLILLLCSNVCLLPLHLLQKTKTPELIPEDDAGWMAGSGKNFPKSEDLKLKISSFTYKMHDLLSDPRIGPVLLLVALMLSGRIWLQRSQSSQNNSSNSSSRSGDKVSNEHISILIYNSLIIFLFVFRVFSLPYVFIIFPYFLVILLVG